MDGASCKQVPAGSKPGEVSDTEEERADLLGKRSQAKWEPRSISWA